MARPRKADGEKLVPVCTSLSPARFDELDRLARARDIPLAEVLRLVIEMSFRKCKIVDVHLSC